MPQKTYEYERIKTPVSDQKTLRNKGYTPFYSSNVSAGQRKEKDLYIRFHNGSVYKYPNKGKRFNDLALSPSKGKWVWANLRRTNAAYSKVGSMPLSGDLDLTDEQLKAQFNKKYQSKQVPLLTGLLSTMLPSDNIGLLLALMGKEQLLAKGIIAARVAL
ncbi:MAG: hypothetical protein J7L15_05515 [Clostridiales bacterium]|nr:hypothetical protein [Clostridiales bacterium]